MKIASSAARVALMTAILTLLPGITAYAVKCHQSLHDSLGNQKCFKINCEGTTVSANCDRLGKNGYSSSTLDLTTCGKDSGASNADGQLVCHYLTPNTCRQGPYSQTCSKIKCATNGSITSAQCITAAQKLNNTSFTSSCGTNHKVENSNGHLKCV